MLPLYESEHATVCKLLHLKNLFVHHAMKNDPHWLIVQQSFTLPKVIRLCSSQTISTLDCLLHLLNKLSTSCAPELELEMDRHPLLALQNADVGDVGERNAAFPGSSLGLCGDFLIISD